MKNRRLAGLAGALVLAASGAASADTIIALTRPGNFPINSFGFLGGQSPVQIAPGTFDSVVFSHNGGDRLVVSYTAKCAVGGFNPNASIELDIRAVNFSNNIATTLPPTVGNNDIFCSANGTPALDGFQMNSVNAVGTALPTGLYRIQVRARINGGFGNNAVLGDSSLIVWR